MKRLAIVLACVLTLTAFAGCGEAAAPVDTTEPTASVEETKEEAVVEETAKEEEPEFDTELEKTLYEASKMTDEEIYELAKAETGKTVVYSTTSLEANALETFLAK